MSTFRIGQRLAALVLLNGFIVAAMVVVGLEGLGALRDDLRTVYEDRTVALAQLAEVQNALQRIRIGVINAVLADAGEERRRHMDEVATLDKRIDEVWASYGGTTLTAEEGSLADDYAGRLAAYRAVKARVVSAAESGAAEEAFRLMRTDGAAAYRTGAATMDALMQLQTRVAAETYAGASAAADSSRTTALLLGGLGLIAGFVAATFIVRSITAPLGSAVAVMGRLADDDLSVEVPGRQRRDEVGAVCRAVQVFKDNMVKARQMEAAQQAERQARQQRAEKIETLTRAFDVAAGDVLQQVAAAASQMQSTSGSMSATAEQTTRQAIAVAAAAEQAAGNVQTVAAATEELAASPIRRSRSNRCWR